MKPNSEIEREKEKKKIVWKKHWMRANKSSLALNYKMTIKMNANGIKFKSWNNKRVIMNETEQKTDWTSQILFKTTTTTTKKYKLK